MVAKTENPTDLNIMPIDLTDVKDDSIAKIESRRDVRALIFQILYTVDRFDYTISPEEVIERLEKGFDLELPENFFNDEKMLSEVIEQRKELDEQITPLLKNWKLERLGCCTRLILRMAVWELNQPDAIPSIVINEAIELAKCFAEKDAHKFVNGILDEYGRKMNLISSKDNETVESDS